MFDLPGGIPLAVRGIVPEVQKKAKDPLLWGNYELLEVLGRGGMATVVRARRRMGEQVEVALKFPHPELYQDESALRAFRLESQLGQDLRHPCLGRTYGMETADGREALVLELIRGPSLHTVHEELLQGSFEEPDICIIASLVASVARGLQVLHIHRAADGTPLRAVHRDVTPKNIIMTNEGVPKVVDFGIAFSAVRNFRTATGMIKGKIAYMAPEYLRGLPWDHRIDIWSLGIVLWELLTGRRLFSSISQTRTIQAILSAPVPSPSLLRPEIPEALSNIVLMALRREASERTPSATLFAAELEEFLNRTGIRHDAQATAAWLERVTGQRESAVFRRDGSRASTRVFPKEV